MDRVDDLTEEDRRLLRQFLSPTLSGGNTTFHVNLGGYGVAIAVGAAVIALVAVVLQGQRISDMKADHLREIDRIERRHEQLAEWARTESNITRGYIWTGKVPVANPYPKQTEAAP